MIETTIKEMQQKAREFASSQPIQLTPTAEDHAFVLKYIDLNTLIASSVRAGYEARDREVREIVQGMKKDGKEIRDMFFPKVEGDPVPNEEWSDIINWKNAYNSALTDLSAKLNSK